MDNIITSKVDDSTLGVVETKPAEVLPLKLYDYGFLKQQLIDITAQRDAMIALKEAELLEVNALILEADKLGIKAKSDAPPIDVTPVDEIIP